MDEIRTAVVEIYARADAAWSEANRRYGELTGAELPCGRGCSDCCKASIPGIPFVSPPVSWLEAGALREALLAQPKTIRDFLVERALREHVVSCLLLSPVGLCLAYEGRPLWCRVFGLPGAFTACGKAEVVSLPEWAEAVVGAFAELRKLGGGPAATIRELVEGLR